MRGNIPSLFILLLTITCCLQWTKGAAIINSADKADIRDFPYMVALLDDDLDEFLGLGVLVSKNVIFCEEIL